MEQREHNAELKAMNLIQEFVKKFRSIDFTLHPSDIPTEAPGKGSNMAWAARKLSERYSTNQRKDVIVTGIDGTCALNLISLHQSHVCAASEAKEVSKTCISYCFDTAHLKVMGRIANVVCNK